jgi:hypothetical protein
MRFGVVLALCLSTGVAHASHETPPVRLLLRSCNEYREADVERMLAAELSGDSAANTGTSTEAEPNRDPTWVVARCEDSRVLLEVNDPLSRKTLKRSINLKSSATNARPRVIAIAAAELVLASWAELSVQPHPRVEPEGKAPDEAQAAAAVARVRRAARLAAIDPRWQEPQDAAPIGLPRPPPEKNADFTRVIGFAGLRRFVDRDGWLYGGGVRLGGPAGSWSGYSIDAYGETGSFAGSLRMDTWTLGGAVYVSAQPHHSLTLRGGLGLRAGLAVSMRTQSGESGSSHSSLAIWGWPMLCLSTTLRQGRLAIELYTEGGYATLPVSAISRSTALRGAWLGLQLGLGVAP